MSDDSAQNSTENSKEHRLAPYRWKPGQSGNPGGRPKRKWLTEIYEEMLEEIASDPSRREELKESLRAKMLAKGVVSSMIIQQVQDRTEGKLTQPVDVSGEIDIVSIIEQGRKRIGEGDPQ